MDTSTPTKQDLNVGECAAHAANDADNNADGRTHGRFWLRRHQDIRFVLGVTLIGHGRLRLSSTRAAPALGITMIRSAFEALAEAFARR